MAVASARGSEWLSSRQVDELASALGDSTEAKQRRHVAYERFLELPLEPNPLYRGYGYFTNVDLTGLDPLAQATKTQVPPARPDEVRVVHDAAGTHVDLAPALRDQGVKVSALPTAGESLPATGDITDRLAALSAALTNRGFLLDVPTTVRTPVRVRDLTILTQPHEALSIRRGVQAGAGTQLLLTEEVYSTPDPPEHQRFHASSTELTLDHDAKAVVLTVHAPDRRTVSAYRRNAVTGPHARVAWLWAGLGGYRTKARNASSLVGSGSVVDDFQLFYGAGDTSYDSSVNLTHIGTDTHGQSITRGVFTDRARGMSRGLVRIEKDAAKTLSFISEHAMLLSRGARSDTIPILEILCRDVKATHSTSVHPVDPEQVFYLESRGFDEKEAVRMIGEGFLSHVLERAPIASLRDLLFPALEARWNGEELPWRPDGSRSLPELQVTGTEATPEWRFDTKLR